MHTNIAGYLKNAWIGASEAQLQNTASTFPSLELTSAPVGVYK